MSVLSRLFNIVILHRFNDDPGPYDASKVRKILVVRNDNIGDVICTTPMLDALREAFPQAHIAAVVCTLAEEAISGHRALDRLWVYPKAKHKQYGAWQSLRMLQKMLADIRRQGYDLVLAPRSSFSSSQGWLVFASGGRWRYGPRAKDKKERWGFYYNMGVDWPPGNIHEVERCFNLLGNINIDSADKSLYLNVPKESADKAAAFLNKNGLDHGGPFTLVNVARWQYSAFRRWPEERYRQLIERLMKRPEGLVVTHAPADREWISGLLAGLDVPVFWSKSLKDFAAMIKAASLFVTVEGGPMHIAAAVNTPQAVLWSKRTPLDVWTPWNAPFFPLKAEETVEEIQVDDVVEAVEKLLAEREV